MPVALANVTRLVPPIERTARESEAREYSFEAVEKALQLIVDPESISLAISDQTDKVPHQQTKCLLTSNAIQEMVCTVWPTTAARVYSRLRSAFCA
jgi:hypothetical protein